MKDIEPLLREIGMKEYEAKAWLTLLKNGTSTADAVSKLSGIPVTRVYETLDSLEKRGLVIVQKSRPKKYSIISVDSLRNILDEKRRKMERELEKSSEIIKRIKDSVPAPPDNPLEEETETVWILNGRENILAKINEVMRKAKREILVFSDDLSWYDRIEKSLTCRSGRTVKILINLNEHTMNTAKKALSSGIKVRGWEMKGLMGAMIDGKLLYLVSKIPKPGVNEKDYYGKPGSDELFSYQCLVTGNPILVRMFRSYYDSFWWRGENPEKTLK